MPPRSAPPPSFDLSLLTGLASRGLLGGRRGGGGGGAAGLLPTPLSQLLDAPAILARLRSDSALADSLLPLLPPGQQTAAHLEGVIRSPHLQSAARSLGEALSDPVERQGLFLAFGLRLEDGVGAAGGIAGMGDPLGMLVHALQAQAARRAAAAGAGAGASGGGGGGAGGKAMEEEGKKD